jgi:hypothetical protein
LNKALEILDLSKCSGLCFLLIFLYLSSIFNIQYYKNKRYITSDISLVTDLGEKWRTSLVYLSWQKLRTKTRNTLQSSLLLRRLQQDTYDQVSRLYTFSVFSLNLLAGWISLHQNTQVTKSLGVAVRYIPRPRAPKRPSLCTIK